jgi:hypothetical protein
LSQPALNNHIKIKHSGMKINDVDMNNTISKKRGRPKKGVFNFKLFSEKKIGIIIALLFDYFLYQLKSCKFILFTHLDYYSIKRKNIQKFLFIKRENYYRRKSPFDKCRLQSFDT